VSDSRPFGSARAPPWGRPPCKNAGGIQEISSGRSMSSYPFNKVRSIASNVGHCDFCAATGPVVYYEVREFSIAGPGGEFLSGDRFYACPRCRQFVDAGDWKGLRAWIGPSQFGLGHRMLLVGFKQHRKGGEAVEFEPGTTPKRTGKPARPSYEPRPPGSEDCLGLFGSSGPAVGVDVTGSKPPCPEAILELRRSGLVWLAGPCRGGGITPRPSPPDRPTRSAGSRTMQLSFGITTRTRLPRCRGPGASGACRGIRWG
jgi:hypothetical protein